MNYIEQIKGFWLANEEYSFSTTDIALYFYLLEVNNICSWKENFKRNNQKIMADLSITYKTLHASRQRLQQSGIISFKTQNGNSNVTYNLWNFSQGQGGSLVEVRDEVQGEVRSRFGVSKDKLNQTKNINISPITPVDEISSTPEESINPISGPPPSSAAPPSEKEIFDEFRKSYPGMKGGLETEFKNFVKKHKDHQLVVGSLLPALLSLMEWKEKADKAGKFAPDYAHLSTWINQRRWEVELPKIEVNGSKNSSIPVTTGNNKPIRETTDFSQKDYSGGF